MLGGGSYQSSLKEAADHPNLLTPVCHKFHVGACIFAGPVASQIVEKDVIVGGVPGVDDIEVIPKYLSDDLDVNPKSILEGKMRRIQDPRSSHSTTF
jgi:hypothetical protein